MKRPERQERPEREERDAPRVRPSAKKKPKAKARDEDEDDVMDEDLEPSVGGEVFDEVEFSDEDSPALKLPKLSDSMDLVTITGLLQWTSSALRKVGRDHLIFLLNLSEQTGRIPAHTREVLEAIVPLFEMANHRGESLSVKQVISMMAQLDGFLGNVSANDTRLLPFLLQDELEVFPLIRP